MAKKKKTNKTVDYKDIITTKNEVIINFFKEHYPCETCTDQCAGHGGGCAAMGGGCLCNDGVFLECLIG
jgi:hypothetical protein